jgi:hypothetical protein
MQASNRHDQAYLDACVSHSDATPAPYPAQRPYVNIGDRFRPAHGRFWHETSPSRLYYIQRLQYIYNKYELLPAKGKERRPPPCTDDFDRPDSTDCKEYENKHYWLIMGLEMFVYIATIQHVNRKSGNQHVAKLDAEQIERLRVTSQHVTS